MEVKSWVKDGIRYSLWSGPHYCGYCTFPKRITKESGYGGILTYVPVHGGITFAEQSEDGMRYGFDCAHAGDDMDPKTWDEVWLVGQCELMANGIIVAAQFEDEYLLAEGDVKKRADVLDRYHASLGASFDIRDNFGAMINLLAGEL